MKELGELLIDAELLVNRSIVDIDRGEIGLKEVEDRIVQFVNRIGALLVDRVVQGVRDPVTENRVWLDGKQALYKGDTPLQFINRFGATVSRKRRGYRIEGQTGRWHPLDEKLGLHVCCGYSPLMTYLLSLFGSGEAFEPGAKKLSSAVGISISATALQHNTETVGRQMDSRPLRSIDSTRQNTSCDLMLVEIDGTTSPQIKEVEGISGRESLKQPTEYKECNVVVIEKFAAKAGAGKDSRYERKDRWTGAKYGKRVFFEQYVHEAGMKMGQMKADQVVFIADGAKHNWEIQMSNFHDAIAILDVYHALEHLAEFCTLYKNETKGKQHYARWRDMMLVGDTFQLLHEMKEQRKNLTDRGLGQKHINYFFNNIKRMAYDQYRAMGLPIGSGLVEGSCKLVVGRRFKGNGMRWKLKDNESVLKARLAEINGDLVDFFSPKNREISFIEPEIYACQPGAAHL